MVVALLNVALAVELPVPVIELDPGFFSNTFQNLSDSSAAMLCQCMGNTGRQADLPAVASICPSGLRQLCRTRLSWAGISTFLTRVG